MLSAPAFCLYGIAFHICADLAKEGNAFPRPLPPPVISAFLPFKFITFFIYTVCKIKKIKPPK
jgi:hypothetical protein